MKKDLSHLPQKHTSQKNSTSHISLSTGIIFWMTQSCIGTGHLYTKTNIPTKTYSVHYQFGDLEFRSIAPSPCNQAKPDWLATFGAELR